jgi:hypothetical protein
MNFCSSTKTTDDFLLPILGVRGNGGMKGDITEAAYLSATEHTDCTDLDATVVLLTG